ncbi:acyl-CoA dehydrogenase family protein [Brevundimonas staleyi]|uniref:Acyl-CoA dehydrogenase family protein n=1 Tax=Brevundimonas staleyi TaxID=74326 RepID=A0ABW0FPS6_9CAUL
MDHADTAFRTEVRDWIAAHFPPSLKGRSAPLVSDPLDADQLKWREAVGAKGWGVPTWPKAYGGADLDRAQARIIERELAAAGAYDPIQSMGTIMFGPTLLEHGTDLQKLRHLPGIARGEVKWCQGFSEPGAGSDLASLQTRAEDRGDHFLINGQKVWTSNADHSDWCFCLVRTDTSRKQGGISFVLFDMHQPGVEVRPIRLISGDSPFCETFLTDVRAEKDDLVGSLNAGWGIAKRLLQHERSAISGGGDEAGTISLIELARERLTLDAEGRIADGDLRARIIRNEMQSRVVEQTIARAIAEDRAAPGASAVSSILKNAGVRVFQDRAELILEIMGHQGLGWEGDGFTDEELHSVRDWLHGKAWSIFGGSEEVQNNIIAKRILGLPDLAAPR